MYELKTISPKSSSRVFSFVLSAIYLVFGVISLVTGSTSFSSGAISLAIGVVLFAIIGAISGVIIAWCYNLVANKWGGLHLDFRLIDDEEKDK